MRFLSSSLLRGLYWAGAIAALVALYGAFQMYIGVTPLQGTVEWIASFGCFGFMLGAIYAFDSKSEFKVASRPLLRIALSGIAGYVLSVLWSWPSDGTVLACVLSSVLGYLGMSWAKYVDF
jgi:hypothetical protein